MRCEKSKGDDILLNHLGYITSDKHKSHRYENRHSYSSRF